MICRKYSFLKLTQFSLGINVYIPMLPLEDTCVSSTQLNRPIWNKMSLSPLENYDFRKCSFEKLTQFLLGNNEVYAPASNTDSCLSRDPCVSSN
jgi:hypothetical protein